MFRSQYSNKLYGPGISPVRVIIAKRAKQYTNKVYREGKLTHTTSFGMEIAQEMVIGPDEIHLVKGAE